MTINISRPFNGTLSVTLAATGSTAVDFSCQVTNCRVTTAHSDVGDPLTVLCGDSAPAGRKNDGWQLQGTLVQDYNWQDGVMMFLIDHDLEKAGVEFTPNDMTDPAAVVITGNVTLECPEDSAVGGDVNANNTGDFSWNFDAKPTFAFTPALP
jgi:hypothetical protein